MIYNRVFEEIAENKRLREEGKHIVIPFPFPRFSRYVPGIQKGRYIICTANSKVGKSKFTDFMFMYNPINFVQTVETNIKVKVIYFSLEQSKEDKIKEYISHLLFKKHKIILSPQLIDSIYNHYILPDDILEKVQALQEDLNNFEKRVSFHDTIRNPYGIYKKVREYAHTNGYYVDKNDNRLDTKLIEAGKDEVFKIDHYVQNDPDEYVIIITDHLSLLTPEADDKSAQNALHSAMGRFSSKYCLSMRDRWKYIIVNVQQQAAAQEGIENLKMDKVQPSPAGLGDNKLTGRDCDMMLGLFSPARYKIRNYEDYDIAKLKDYHRELSIILNRRGNSVATQLYFHGGINYLKELKPPNRMTPKDYKDIIDGKVFTGT